METSKVRVEKLKKLASKRRIKNFLSTLGQQTRRELGREAKRQIRGRARQQLKRFLPMY